MNIVFFGSTNLGYRCCEKLLEQGEKIGAILTIPKTFPVSYAARPLDNVHFRNFETLANQHSIPLIRIDRRISEAQKETIARLKPDFGLVVGWYYIIPASVRRLFPMGVAGLHASLLPKYRGGSPLVWAMINGERRAGVSLFYFEDKIDAGDIIEQRDFPIDAEDTIKEVYQKATDLSVEMIGPAIRLIREGASVRSPQDESQASYFRPRTPADGSIDWSWPAEQIRNFIRAQTKPYPGAFTVIGDKKVIIWDADVVAHGSDEADAR